MPTDSPDELVVRLRSERHLTQGDGLEALLRTAAEAADRIEAADKRNEALEAENERLRRNIKGWVEWHRRCDADDDCTYLNDNAWCGADALASTGMGLLAHAAMQQKERDDG